MRRASPADQSLKKNQHIPPSLMDGSEPRTMISHTISQTIQGYISRNINPSSNACLISARHLISTFLALLRIELARSRTFRLLCSAHVKRSSSLRTTKLFSTSITMSRWYEEVPQTEGLEAKFRTILVTKTSWGPSRWLLMLGFAFLGLTAGVGVFYLSFDFHRPRSFFPHSKISTCIT